MRFDYESVVDGYRDWALALPPVSPVKDWVVVIHGHGAHGNQLYMRQDIKKSMLPVYLKRGLGILTPNLRDNAWMSPAAVTDMDEMLDFVRAHWESGRFFFASGSMGATSNLIYASLRPANVAGVVARGAVTDLTAYHAFARANQEHMPILHEIADCIEGAYGGTPEGCPELYRLHSPLLHPEAFADIPVLLMHGTRDKLMDVSQSRRFAAALADNLLFAYIEIPGGAHDSPLVISEQSDNSFISPMDWISGAARN